MTAAEKSSHTPGHAPLARIFALPLRLGQGTASEAPIFDRNGELRAECVDDDCEERAIALIRAANCYDEMLEALKAFIDAENTTGNSSVSLAAYDRTMERASRMARAVLAKVEGRS